MTPPVIPSVEPFQVRLISLNQPDDRPDKDYGYVAVIIFNKPERANALSPEACVAWLNALTWAAETEAVRAVILTGNGQFYCSGQELGVSSIGADDYEQDLRRRARITEELVGKLIDFPKLIVAAVNGPVYGFGTTHLALCDAIYATKEATFKTPFMELGFCAEGCSSVLFPRIMGRSRANEMILMGRQFNAEEMVECKYVSQVLPSTNFLQHVLDIVVPAARYPPSAIRQSKALIMSEEERAVLHEVNKRELTLLVERMLSTECHEAVAEFLIKKRKRANLAKNASKSSKL
ncbi:ClpP/crotonase-like domain-containing protein [Syncephalis plumigaleata]|nr:ClpP/crotonase-like domain-containing protein [Syncephalis plumigaleata]